MNVRVGEFVVFKKAKASTRPSLRAKNVYPARHGDTYYYVINKLWKVVQVFDDKIEIETRRGKRLRVDKNTPLLRKAGLWDRLTFWDRFF